MLHKDNRVKVERFKEIFEKGKTQKSYGFLIKALKNNDSNTKAAIVVSKKLIKNAVDRNKHRRRVYNFLKENLNDLPCVDVIIIANKNFVSGDSDSRNKSLEQLLKDLQKIKF